MLKKSITYKDLDGNDVTDDFYFALSKPEIIKLEMNTKGGLESLIQQLIAAEEGGKIIELLDEIVRMSIGKRSSDGKRFVKNQEIRDEFFQSNAYEVFFMELFSDAEKSGTEFIKGIMPADFKEAMDNGQTVTNVTLPATDEQPAYIRENRDPTPDEVKKMTPEQLQDAFRRRTIPNSM